MNRVRVRVLEVHTSTYVVMTEDKKTLEARLNGNLIKMSDSERPTVGDWVYGELQPGNWVYVNEVQERKNILQRWGADGNPQALGANLDFLFIVCALNQDFNLNRLERYVSMAYACQIQPVIVLSKVDLVDNPETFLDSTAERFPAVDIHAISTTEIWNLDSLYRYFTDNSCVGVVGSSGVGKSTLVNFFLGKNIMQTGDIRADDGRGKHTTTHRSLHLLENGAWLMDTPGLRSLALWAGDEGTDLVFSDIVDLGYKCRFKDCQHQTEPGCQIRAALENGTLSPVRWNNYGKLQREEAFRRRKHDKAEASEQKKVWKQRNQQLRKKLKQKGRK